MLATKTAPAREWLRESNAVSSRTLGEMDTELSIDLVEHLRALGATEVLAVQIESSDSIPGQTTNHLVVALPADLPARARVFAFTNAYSKDQGFEREPDWGQTHLYVMLC